MPLAQDQIIKSREIVENFPIEKRKEFISRYRSLSPYGKETALTRLLNEELRSNPSEIKQQEEIELNVRKKDVDGLNYVYRNDGPFLGNIVRYKQKSKDNPEDIEATLISRDARKDPVGALVDSFTFPMLELANGVQKGAAGFYNILDSSEKLLSNISGIGRSGIFKNYADMINKSIESSPKTDLPPIIKTIYEIAGETPMFAAELAILKKPSTAVISNFAKPASKIVSQFPSAGQYINNFFESRGVSGLSDISSLALAQTLKDYSTSGGKLYDTFNESFKDAVSGFMAGGLVGKAFNLFNNFGKTAAKALIQYSTGSKELAEEFVKNPNRFNTNIFKSVKDLKILKEENELIKKELAEKTRLEGQQFRLSQDQKIYKIREDARILRENLKTQLEESIKILKEKKEESLDSLMKRNAATVEQFNKTMNAHLVNVYDNFSNKINILRKQQGQEVGSSLDALIAIDPLIKTSSKRIREEVTHILEKFSPFKYDKTRLIPKTEASNKKDADLLTRIISQFKNNSKHDRISLDYLQALKKDTYSLSEKYFSSGNPRLGVLYKNLSEKVNPINFIDDVQESAPAVKIILERLKSANAKYADLMPRYEEAIEKFFLRDSQGKLVPNISKAIAAIEKNDIAQLRLMKRADLALPEEDRILSKVVDNINARTLMATEQKATIKNLKRKFLDNLSNLERTNKDSLRNLEVNNRRISAEALIQRKNEIFDFTHKQQSKYTQILKDLTSAENHLEKEILLRRIMAQGEASSIIQKMAFFSGLYAKHIGSPIKFIAATPIALSSPIISSNIIKGFDKIGAITKGTEKRIDKLNQIIYGEDSLKKFAAQAFISRVGTDPTRKLNDLILENMSVDSEAHAGEKTLGDKNNNFINLKAGKDKWLGMTGIDKYGHAIFETRDHGIRAALKNLYNHKKNNLNQTLAEYMNKFAEKNQNKEAKFIADYLKISVNEKLKNIDMDKMIIPLSKFESKQELTEKEIKKVKEKFNLK